MQHLTKDVFFNKMEELLSVFPSWNIDFTDEKVVQAWYKHFKDTEEKTFVIAVDEYIENERYNHTVAGIMEYVREEEESFYVAN